MAAKSQQMPIGIFEMLENGINQRDPTVIGILIAVIVGLLTIVFFLFSRSKGNKRNILIAGTCDSGKTLLFSRLIHKSSDDILTVTSMKPNVEEYKVQSKNKSLQLVDLPGHEKLRTQNLEKYKTSTKGILYVIDSGTAMKEIKDIAGYLYTILSDGCVSGSALPVLIACNKADLTLKKGKDIIKKNLAAEMNTLRTTRSAAIQQLDGSGNNNVYLGRRDRDFSFEDLKPMKVEFVECSAQTGSVDIESIENWLTNIA